MGMYTEIRVRATIKHKYVDLILAREDLFWREILKLQSSEKEQLNENLESKIDNFLIDKFKNINLHFLKKWEDECPRIDMIPFGNSTYFDQDPEWEYKFDPETRYWQFQFNLKNYDEEIEKFLSYVLPELAEEVHECWYHYEEDDTATKLEINCF